MTVDDPDARSAAAAEDVEVFVERAQVRLVPAAAIVLQAQRHRITAADLVTIDTRGKLRLRWQDQYRVDQDYRKGVGKLHGCGCRRMRCSIINLRRSRPPGSSGMRRSH